MLLCFGCWPYYIPSWYYSYSQNKTNYADQICPKLEKSGAASAAPHIGKDLVLLGLLGFGRLLGFLRSGRFLFRVLLDGHLDDGLMRLLGSGSLSLGGLVSGELLLRGLDGRDDIGDRFGRVTLERGDIPLADGMLRRSDAISYSVLALSATAFAFSPATAATCCAFSVATNATS